MLPFRATYPAIQNHDRGNPDQCHGQGPRTPSPRTVVCRTVVGVAAVVATEFGQRPGQWFVVVVVGHHRGSVGTVVVVVVVVCGYSFLLFSRLA